MEDDMKKALKHTTVAASVLLLGLLASAPAFADAPIRQGGNFGLGIGGDTYNSGLSLKYYMSSGQALQGVVGFNYRRDWIGLNLDYLFEMPALATGNVVELGWNLGPGAAVGISDYGVGAAVAGVAGLEFNFNPVPIDLVLEWRPSLNIVPNVDLDLVGFTGHIRFYF